MRISKWLFSLFLALPVLIFSEISETKVKAPYFYDPNGIRYELYQTNGKKGYNWLFLPGGPGSDSRYLHSLIDLLDLPGNVWLIDLPGSGSNSDPAVSYDFEQWFDIFPAAVEKFSNPILVGHSFGGQFPLLFPQLEKSLKGFVILHSSPSLWVEEALSYAKQFDLPSFGAAVGAFSAEPNQQTFEAAIEACMPYYFPPSTLEAGKKLFAQAAFQFPPAVWWGKKVAEINFSAKWIPEQVPTLIIGGKYDCMCPFSLFQKDSRFDRKNVTMLLIKNGGHCSWIENPQAIQKAFAKFVKVLSKKTAVADDVKIVPLQRSL